MDPQDEQIQDGQDGLANPDHSSDVPPAASSEPLPGTPQKSEAPAHPPLPPIRFWRKYVYLYLPVFAILPFIWFARTAILTTHNPMEVLLMAPTISILIFFVSNAIYPSARPPPTAADLMPWTQKSQIYRIVGNMLYNFLTGGDISIRGLVIDAVLTVVFISMVGRNSLKKKSTTKSDLTTFVTIFGIEHFFPFLLMPIPAPLRPLISHFSRVYRRVVFLSLLDDFIAFLIYPPQSRRGKFATFLLQATAFTVVIVTLSVRTQLLNIWSCQIHELDLMATYACYSGLNFKDPNFLQKQALCYSWRSLDLTAEETADELAARAGFMAFRCRNHYPGVAEYACRVSNRVVNGPEGGPYAYLETCPNIQVALRIFAMCSKRYNPNNVFSSMLESMADKVEEDLEQPLYSAMMASFLESTSKEK